MFAIPRELPFPFPFPQNSLGGEGGQSLQSQFSPKNKQTERVVRNKVEEETARKKQAQAWGAALLVSAQNMDIPAHSSSVPVSAVGAAAAQQSLILPTVQHDSEAEHDEIDKLVVLRMDQEFMKFGASTTLIVWMNLQVGKFGTVLPVESNIEMGAVDIDSDSHSDWS